MKFRCNKIQITDLKLISVRISDIFFNVVSHYKNDITVIRWIFGVNFFRTVIWLLLHLNLRFSFYSEECSLLQPSELEEDGPFCELAISKLYFVSYVCSVASNFSDSRGAWLLSFFDNSVVLISTWRARYLFHPSVSSAYHVRALRWARKWLLAL